MKKNSIRNFALPHKIEVYFYIFLMSIAFLTYGSRYQLPAIIPELIALVLFAYSVFKHYQNKTRSQSTDKQAKMAKTLFVLYFIPVFLIHAYSIILMMLGAMNKSYLSTNISAYAPVLAAVSSIYLFGADALKYNLVAILVTWGANFLISLIIGGIGIIPFAISQGYFNNTNPILGVKTNFFELHDMIFALGIFLVYFFYTREKMNKKDLALLVVIAIIMLLGVKRIAIVGLVVAIIIAKLIKNKSALKMQNFNIIIGCTIFVTSFVFLYMIFTNKFNELSASINLMGRNYYYDTIKNYGKFSPFFLGTGRNSVAAILTGRHSYLHVSGVHSDILKMFVENGFIVFVLWLVYYLFYLPRKIQKNFDTKTMGLYLALLAYTFILYFTDNVENYFIYQIFFIITPCCYYLKYHKIAPAKRSRKKANAPRINTKNNSPKKGIKA